MSSIFTELKRRNVIRVALLYRAGGLDHPPGGRAAVRFARAAELGREACARPVAARLPARAALLVDLGAGRRTGSRRESQIDRSEATAGPGMRKLDIAIVALLVLTIAIVAIDRLLPDRASVPAAKTAADSASIPPATAGRAASTASAGPSIAVLPFVDMSASRQRVLLRWSDGGADLEFAGEDPHARGCRADLVIRSTRARTWTCG